MRSASRACGVKRFRRHCIARCISPSIWNVRGATPEPLYFLGSLAGRRYTPRGGPAGLYLAFDPATPPAELRAVVFEHGFPVSSLEHDPIVTIAVRSVVHHVLNLMDPGTVTTLELRDADLKADWEGGQAEYLAGTAPMPATQLLALAAHESGLCAGIKYPSARTDFGVNPSCSQTGWMPE